MQKLSTQGKKDKLRLQGLLMITKPCETSSRKMIIETGSVLRNSLLSMMANSKKKDRPIPYVKITSAHIMETRLSFSKR
jgi:hypothetical protein